MTDEIQGIAAQVQQRAAELTPDDPRPVLDKAFIQACLDANERGDGCLFATIHRGKFIYNVTPEKGEWYAWNGHVWTKDEFRRAINAIEECALEYQQQADTYKSEIKAEAIDKHHKDAWKLALHKKYQSRADRLRQSGGAAAVLNWAPVVEPSMACRESDFDKQPWLLPVKNGIIDLRTGAMVSGRPQDLLTRALSLDYDPHADYTPWQNFIDEVSGCPEVAAFIKRSFGYAITGHSYEQFIWVFTGPGRNGKGVLFDLIGDVMRQYYHVISRSMIIEQRSEPSPAAASEHKYSLLGKRIIVAAETNKGQKIDDGAVKGLTGDDEIVCRPNFKSEITFSPTHTTFLHCNHIPVGLTRDFAMVQRLLKVEFPYMYVDDPEAEAKKKPVMASRFRKKDPTLKDKLRQIKPGILRWLVEGTREWIEHGLAPPASIKEAVQILQDEEDYVGRFLSDCLIRFEDDPDMRLRTTDMYSAFRWWWGQNMDESEKRIPVMKTINAALRDKGHTIDAVGGKTYLWGHAVNPEIEQEVAQFIATKSH
jgi:putative DNA primase/helicase